MSEPIRKLATIVSLDVAGYSARTEADEGKTIAQIALLRPLIDSIATSHGGRVFNTAGDGFMLEFSSSGSAVEAALELAEECRPKVRVGVHVGDVSVQTNGDVLGHGVNVAARLMAKSEPGRAIISADVRRMIRGPLADRFVSRGTVQLDKMAETIEIFAVADAASHTAPKPASKPAFAWKAPTRNQAAMLGGAGLVLLLGLIAWSLTSGSSTPAAAQSASIAVLPFENLSTDKDNAFFAVGIQDEILTRLAKIGSLKVISRTSTAHLASRPENLPDIARQLGVANILEGSVQRQGDSVRVNVQLIKADTDGHLWAEIYDRKLDNIFSVQSEIAIAVAEALSAKVTGSEKKDLAVAPTKNAAAYDAYLRGLAFIRKGSFRDATRSLQEAVKRDPAFAVALAALSRAESRTYHDGERTASRRDVAQQALNAALRLQPNLPEVLMAQAYFQYWVERDFAGARLRFEQVSAKWPNDADATSALGYIARRQGRWDQTRAYMLRAAELDPLSFSVRLDVVENYFNMRDFEGARSSVDASLNIWPDSAWLMGMKAQIYQAFGELEQAKVLLTGIQMGAEESDAIDAVYMQGIYSRQYADAITPLEALLARDRATGAEVIFVDTLYLYLGDLKRLAGDSAAATAYYNHVRDDVGSELKRQPGNALLMNLLALAYCGLGDRNAAMTYADQLVTLVPVTKDAFDGVGWENTRARIWARFGDRDRAIPVIAKLLKLPAGGLTPAILRMDPAFDKLRGDPRFEALLK